MKNKKSVRVIKILFYIAILLSAASAFDNNTYAEHSLSLSTSSAHTIDVSGAGNGATISSTEINVATSCQAGYNLSLTTTVNDNRLYLNGDVNNYATGDYISPADGNTGLVSADNTWGYYLPEVGGEAPTVNSVFSAVPTLGNSAVLRTPAQTARSTEINDTLSLYYGVKVTNTLTSGPYTMIRDEDENVGTIVYYATLPEACFRYVIEYNPTGTNTGMPITGIGSIDSQYALEGISTNLTSEVYDNPIIDGVTYYFTGWNTAQDGTGTRYTSGESVTDLTATGTTITLYAQWTDCPSESICYIKNHEDAEGAMGHQAAASDTAISLLAPNYSLSRHGFIGWSEDEDAAIKYINHEAVTIFGPNQTITTGDLSITGLHLYAVWLEANDTLQDWNGCDDLEIGDVVALQDARDDNAYGVAKLADNRCWMIENLRLESQDSTGDNSLLAQAYDSSFIGLATPENSNFSDSSTANSLYSTNGITEKTISGDYTSSRFPRYNNINTASNTDKPSSSNMAIYAYGNYYTWAAVIADTTSYRNQNNAVDTTSICPKGWKIPRGGDNSIEANNDYWTLIVNGINGGVKPSNYNSFAKSYYTGSTEGKTISEALKSFPNNLLQSGYYSSTSALNRGSIGNYWSSVTSISNGAYVLNIQSSRVDPGTAYTSKYQGNVVRCLYAGN